ncbi:MAG TPA: hypothetical protein VMK12_13515 [Anaeromyxobacteraceae bacterium]|nr:hypothetical protein [Anaeromyxobacteraceae bacterium]
MEEVRREPVVRIRCASPKDEARCRDILGSAGLVLEQSLTWLVVRDANPDEVNRLLVAGGALGRAVVREQMGKLIGWLIDRRGELEDRSRNVKSLVERVLEQGGLSQRYQPKPPASLLEAAQALYERLMADGAPFIAWEEFTSMFCESRCPP